MDKIEEMLRENRRDREWFKAHGQFIEAAACAIREKALEDARDAFEEHLWSIRSC